jgi:hypothetical protein
MSKIIFSSEREKSPLDEIVDDFACGTDDDEVQNQIHPELDFSYCSINVEFGLRGSGKTHYTMAQISKMSLLPPEELPHPITQVYISSDKEYDPTIAKFEPNIDPRVQLIKIKQKDTYETMRLIEQTKATFQSVLLGHKSEDDEEEDTDWIYQALNIPNTCKEVPHTIVFIDDCINLLHSDKKLFKILFQNRQPKITYFLALQDITGIPPSMKANMDMLVLFGGFTPQKFAVLINQIPHGGDRVELWQKYKELTKNQYIIFRFNISD